MSTTVKAAPPKTNAQVAKSALDKVAAGGSFSKPVALTSAQLTAFAKKLSTMAKTNPEQASKLLQRTLDLYGAGKLTVKTNSPLSYGGRNDMAAMSNTVIAAIQKADPSVATPAPMMMAR